MHCYDLVLCIYTLCCHESRLLVLCTCCVATNHDQRDIYCVALLLFLAGGGWSLSPGIRSAVEAFAREHRLQLHVEQGTAWTLSGHLILETRNNAAAAGAKGSSAPPPLHRTEADAAAADALRLAADDDALREQRRMAWLGGVFAVIDGDNEDTARLALAVGPHGRRQSNEQRLGVGATLGGAPTAAVGASTDSASSTSTSASASVIDEVWIDTGGDDKRHLTPLIRAAQAGKANLVKALIDEHGADVNAQAARSKYTALLAAAFDGHEEVVKLLLDRGG